MAWETIKTKEAEVGRKNFSVCLTNTGTNLVIEVYEMLDGRIFFGWNYAQEVIHAIDELTKEFKKTKKSGITRSVAHQGKEKKIELKIKSVGKDAFIDMTRKKSENRGLTWLNEKDHRTGIYRKISIPISNKMTTLIKCINGMVNEIESGKVEDPAKKSSLYGVYFPGWMAKHDRSMLAFKTWFDSRDITLYLRLDSNPDGKSDSVKIERAEVAKEAEKAGINFMPERRGEDGWIEISKTVTKDLDEDLIIYYDWEHRRDWVLNYNNIPVYMEEDRKKKVLKFYAAVNHPPGEKISHNYYGGLQNKSIKGVIDYINKIVASHPKPYFVYDTLGQFGRKMVKPQIALSIQCTQIVPMWYKNYIKTMDELCYPIEKGEHLPTVEDNVSYFVVAWHEDFSAPITTIRKTGVGGAEKGGYCTTANFGIFPFTEAGVRLFRNTLTKQFSTGIVKDRNSNDIPKKRPWV